MDAACTGVHGDIVGQHQTAGLGQEGMRSEHILEEAAGVGLDDLVLVDTADCHDLLDERLGDDVHFAVCGLDDSVALVRVQGDGKVAGQRPDGGRPDDEVKLRLIKVRQLAEIIVHGKLDIYGRARVVLILDLGLGQCGLVMSAPVNGLETLVDVAVFIHLAEHTHLVCLEALVHGLVRVLPVADDAQTLEALHLDADVLFGVGLAGRAEVGNTHCLVI